MSCWSRVELGLPFFGSWSPVGDVARATFSSGVALQYLDRPEGACQIWHCQNYVWNDGSWPARPFLAYRVKLPSSRFRGDWKTFGRLRRDRKQFLAWQIPEDGA